ncbi:MAG: trypsin-like peptidase domain-containing protein [Methylophilaceae bacterium]
MYKFAAFLALTLLHTHIYAESRNELTFRLKASVVKVHVGTKSGGHGVGTGVAVGEDLVVTSCHILANSVGVKVTKFGDGLVPVALKADWKHDLCILRFKYAGLTPVELGDSETLKYEQEIFSIGFPGGPPKPQYTEGKIKALYPLDDSAIVRTSASFVMGASGSPVFDKEGKLLAISAFKSPGRNAYYYNLPVKWVKALLKQPDIQSMQTDVLPFWDAPEGMRPFFMQVVLPYKNKKWDEVSRIAELWIKQEPASSEAFFYAGIAKEKLGKLDQAKQRYQETLKLHPQHPAAILGLECVEEAVVEKCDDRY